HVTAFHGLSQGLNGIARGDEFVPNITLVSDFEQSPHHGRIMDFLLVIEFTPSRNPCRVHMPDPVAVLAEATDHVAVHSRDVINVEKQFDAWRPNLPDDLGAVINVVALVTRVALHG